MLCSKRPWGFLVEFQNQPLEQTAYLLKSVTF